MFNLLTPDPGYLAVLAINLAAAFLIIVLVRNVSGILSGVKAVDELAEKDNPAFGIALAGAVFSVTVMMSGVVYGPVSESYTQEIIAVLGYGCSGLALMIITRLAFDRFLLPGVSVKKLILERNVAAAVADAGNVIASALIVRAVIMWSYGNHVSPWLAIPAGYILSQAVMSLLTIGATLKLKTSAKKRSEQSEGAHVSVIETALREDNIAVALRFAGMRIGAAFAVTGASGMISYAEGAALQTAVLWLILSPIFLALIFLLVKAADFVLLAGIDVNDETVRQRNIGVGALQCAIIVSVGMIVAALAH